MDTFRSDIQGDMGRDDGQLTKCVRTGRCLPHRCDCGDRLEASRGRRIGRGGAAARL